MRLLVLLLLATLAPAPSAGYAAAASPPPPGPPDTVVSTPTPARQGAWPLQPRPAVVHGFEPPVTRWGAGHRGVDLLGRPGQGVHATLPGRVTFAARLAGRGVVVVDHGGLRTTYEPVTAGVAVGDQVDRGSLLGTLEAPRSHCAPLACLHWGLLRGETYLDPLTLVGAGPIRLLPLAGLHVGEVSLAADVSWLPTARLLVAPGRAGAARAPVARAGSRAV